MDQLMSYVTSKDQLLTAHEIAHILNVSKALVYRLIQTGKIRSVQIGAARRVRPDDLQAYIEENLTPAGK